METKPKVWLNKNIVPWEEATVPILSHGFSRGSAVFEVIGTHVKAPDSLCIFRMDTHLDRLEQTVKLLEMELKFSSADIADGVKELAAINKSGSGLVKIMAYWGQEAIVDLVLDDKLDVVIFTIPLPDDFDMVKFKPITACLSKWKKLHPQTVPVMAKACANYLNGYLVRKDANNRGFDIGLTLGVDGWVAEGSIESIFIVKNGVLKTPPLGGILESVTRDSIINIAKANDIDVNETFLEEKDLNTADELFTCGTGHKVVPISRFEQHELSAPGPVTTKMTQLLDAIVNFRNDQFSHWFQTLY